MASVDADTHTAFGRRVQPWPGCDTQEVMRRLSAFLQQAVTEGYRAAADARREGADAFNAPHWPFVLGERLNEAPNRALLTRVQEAFLHGGLIDADALRTFFDLVLPAGHPLPRVGSLGGQDVSWFYPFDAQAARWASMRPMVCPRDEALARAMLWNPPPPMMPAPPGRAPPPVGEAYRQLPEAAVRLGLDHELTRRAVHEWLKRLERGATRAGGAVDDRENVSMGPGGADTPLRRMFFPPTDR